MINGTDIIGAIAGLAIIIILALLLTTIIAALGGLVGYAITLSYNMWLGTSVEPLLGALAGSIVCVLSGWTAGASTQ